MIHPSEAGNGLRVVRYLGLPLLTGRSAAMAQWIVDRAFDTTCPTVIAHINANNYYWLWKDQRLLGSLLDEGVLLLDGVAMTAAGWLHGHRHLPDTNGTDLFPLVMEGCRNRCLRVFLLGSRWDVVQRAGTAIGARYRDVSVVGCHDGYFDAASELDVVEAIKSAAPDVLLVGLGVIRQERFALQYRERLSVPLIWNVGGLFDFVSGAKPRAPRVVRRMKLEWLYRFALEPRVMWHRNFVAHPWFLWHTLAAAVMDFLPKVRGPRVG